MTAGAFTFHSLDDGNQHDHIFTPDCPQQWFDEINRKYDWNQFNVFDNKFLEYAYQLNDPLLEQAVNRGIDHPEYFKLLNRGQKIFYCVLLFNGETDNGGVYQFFFNRPEFSYAVLESLKELQLDALARDYTACLDELMDTTNSYNDRKRLFNDAGNSWAQRWEAFRGGYNEMKSAAKIEAYFYQDPFKIALYRTMVEYIDKHLSLFVKQ